VSNVASDRFLLKLFEKTAEIGKISYFDKYDIGKEMGLSDKQEIDRITEILHVDGFVSYNEVTLSKIQLTSKGKKRLENNQI
jgi:hypothetical protein